MGKKVNGNVGRSVSGDKVKELVKSPSLTTLGEVAGGFSGQITEKSHKKGRIKQTNELLSQLISSEVFHKLLMTNILHC